MFGENGVIDRLDAGLCETHCDPVEKKLLGQYLTVLDCGSVFDLYVI